VSQQANSGRSLKTSSSHYSEQRAVHEYLHLEAGQHLGPVGLPYCNQEAKEKEIMGIERSNRYHLINVNEKIIWRTFYSIK